MNALRKAALLCAFLFITLSAFAQTTVSGTKVLDNTGKLLASGQWCFGSTCSTVTTGAFTGTVTPGTQTVTVTNGSGTTYLTIPNLTIGSSAFNWDIYTVPATASISGMGKPIIACISGATYTQTDASPSVAAWTCQSSPLGLAQWINKGQGSNALASGQYSGAGVPTMYCTVPCSYIQTTNQAFYVAVGATGAITNTWSLNAPSAGNTTNGQLLKNNNGAVGAASLSDLVGPNGIGYTPLNKAGDSPTGMISYPSSLLWASNPIQSTPALVNFRTNMHAVSTAATPQYILCLGDSICRGVGPALAANTPINQLMSQIKQFGDGGSGFVPVGQGPSGGSGTANPGWQAVGSAPFPTIECSAGPSQTGTNGECTMWVSQPGEGLRLNGGKGNVLVVAGITDTTTGPITATVDGTVVSTSIGGTTSTPTPFLVRIPLFLSTLPTRSVTFTPTSGSAGIYKIYGAGFENTSGSVPYNYSVPGLRACGFGDATTINQKMAFVGLMSPAPSYALVELGTNDTNNAGGPWTQTQYQTCMTNIKNYLLALNPQMSITFWDPENVVNAGTGGNMTPAQMQQTEQLLAQQSGGQYVSIRDNWGSLANAQAMGLMAGDQTHPSDKGGISEGAILWNSIGDNSSAAVSSAGNTLTIPVNWNGSATSSGNTITLTLNTSIQSFDTTATIEVESCSDSTFNTTGTHPLSVNKNVVTYAVTGTPGASATGCFLNTNEYILDASLLTGSNLYFVNNVDNLAQTGKLINVKAGQTITLTMICSDSVTNTCPASSWPSQFLYAPAAPSSNGGRATQTIFIDNNLAPNLMSPSMPRAFTGTLPTNPIAAGTCVNLTAVLPTTLTANGGYYLNNTMGLTATPQTDPGAGLTWKATFVASANPLVTQTQVNVAVCNPPGNTASVTPTATAFNVVAF